MSLGEQNEGEEECDTKQNKAPSRRIRFRLKTQLFLCGLTFRPHVSGENCGWKRNFLKTLSRVEIFENAVFVVSVWTVKTELFENDDIKVFDSAYPARKALEK